MSNARLLEFDITTDFGDQGFSASCFTVVLCTIHEATLNTSYIEARATGSGDKGNNNNNNEGGSNNLLNLLHQLILL